MEGLLSFLSPCVLPLIPLYIGYLTSDMPEGLSRGQSRIRTMLRTFFFVLGICTVFFLAGLGSSALHTFFTAYEIQFLLVGGFLLLLAGLFSLGVINIPFLNNDRRISLQNSGKMNIFKAYLLGFFFSFAWSPCVGPLLASAVLAAASASSRLMGFVYIGAYALGFILIFIVIGLFTDEMLALLKKHRSIVRYTGILGGLAVAGMGCYMLYQANRTIVQLQNAKPAAAASETSEAAEEQETEEAVSEKDNVKYGFSLYDKDGNLVSLKDFEGKTVLVNFFGTWCYYCQLELPDLQEVEETRDDVKVLLIATPNFGDEKDEAYIENWMEENGYTMQVLYDRDFSVTGKYGISGYPTTYIMKPDGYYLGYMPGYMDAETMNTALARAVEESK